jgi:hypothetical protein
MVAPVMSFAQQENIDWNNYRPDIANLEIDISNFSKLGNNFTIVKQIDLTGDGKKEAIVSLPEGNGGMMYIVTLGSYQPGLMRMRDYDPVRSRYNKTRIAAADYSSGSMFSSGYEIIKSGFKAYTLFMGVTPVSNPNIITTDCTSNVYIWNKRNQTFDQSVSRSRIETARFKRTVCDPRLQEVKSASMGVFPNNTVNTVSNNNSQVSEKSIDLPLDANQSSVSVNYEDYITSDVNINWGSFVRNIGQTSTGNAYIGFDTGAFLNKIKNTYNSRVDTNQLNRIYENLFAKSKNTAAYMKIENITKNTVDSAYSGEVEINVLGVSNKYGVGFSVENSLPNSVRLSGLMMINLKDFGFPNSSVVMPVKFNLVYRK